MNQDNHPNIKLGLTLFFSLSATALVVFLLLHIADIYSGLRVISSALSPLIVGFALAYILHPMETQIEGVVKKGKFVAKASRPISVLVTLLVALCLFALFLVMILPGLTNSIRGLIITLPGQMDILMQKLEGFTQEGGDWTSRIMDVVSKQEEMITKWLENNLLDSLGTIASNLYSAGSFLINLLMSVIVAVYLLLGWERYIAQCKKVFLAISKNRRVNEIVFTSMGQANQIFSGFINGKLVDSLIVGVLTFICLSFMKMPYTLLISVLVGVTNIIPVFGPFIGAVPSAFLVLLVSPAKCFAFLIFIVVLQQIDGNIIGPRILGDSTGLSALYVMTAMLLFGKLMGFIGMVIGVPLFATLYYIVKRLVEHSLKKQNLPTKTGDYTMKGFPEPKKTKNK